MSVEINGKQYTWNAPCCGDCWEFLHPEGRVPVVVETDGVPVQCANCGTLTKSGIFIRRDPRTVRYPALEDDE